MPLIFQSILRFLKDKSAILINIRKGNQMKILLIEDDKNLVKDLESFNLPIYISKDGERGLAAG